MPEVQPPLYVTVNDVYAGNALALPWRDIMGEGVVGETHLEVYPVSPAELAVNVRVGACWIAGDDDPARQGAYRCRSDSIVKLQLAPNPGGQTRPDRIIAEVRDADFSGSARDWRLRPVQGSAGGAPPNIPNNAIALATITVPAAAVSIAAGDIADARNRCVVGGGDAPVGVIGSPIPWLVPTIPPGYIEFAGQAITQARYPKLYALFGGTLPDLRGRSLLGASGAHPVGQVGGADEVQLALGNMPWHDHGNGNHAHGMASTGHIHGLAAGQFAITANVGEGKLGDLMYNDVPNPWTLWRSGGTSYAVAGATTDYSGVIVAGQGNNEAHNNLPPFRAVLWITVAG